MIDRLQAIEDKTLPICVADWQERFQRPSEKQAEIINIQHGQYTPEPGVIYRDGPFVCIGEDS
jgi:hypothetical protein